MPSDTQKRLLLEMFENLPGVVFMLLFRATDDMRLAGWIGTVLAASVCVTYVSKTLRPQPILLGINLFMVAITPLIECLILLGYRDTATILTRSIATLVLMSVFLTGVVLTLFRTNGFLNYQTNGTKQRNTHSAVLLIVCAFGVVWSRFSGDNYLVSLGVPLMVLFGVHQLLRAGTTDQQARNGATLACAAPQGSVSDASA